MALIQISKSKSTVDAVLPVAVLPLTNVVISVSLIGAIYWVQENDVVTITGDISLPDGEYIVMAERMVDATKAVDDVRFKAIVANGAMTINAKFAQAGNYLISAERVNRGLDRIGTGVHLSFDSIEFDVYV